MWFIRRRESNELEEARAEFCTKINGDPEGAVIDGRGAGGEARFSIGVTEGYRT